MSCNNEGAQQEGFSRVVLDSQSSTGTHSSLSPLGLSVVSIVVPLICQLVRHSFCSILEAPVMLVPR